MSQKRDMGHPACVVLGGQVAAHQFVHANRLGTGDFDHAVQRLSDGDVGQGGRNAGGAFGPSNGVAGFTGTGSAAGSGSAAAAETSATAPG